jgi:hypothetical protein
MNNFIAFCILIGFLLVVIEINTGVISLLIGSWIKERNHRRNLRKELDGIEKDEAADIDAKSS